jgi:hypothetical protein
MLMGLAEKVPEWGNSTLLWRGSSTRITSVAACQCSYRESATDNLSECAHVGFYFIALLRSAIIYTESNNLVKNQQWRRFGASSRAWLPQKLLFPAAAQHGVARVNQHAGNLIGLGIKNGQCAV